MGTSILEKGEIYETALLLGYIGDLSTLIAQFPLGDKARNMEIAITGNKIVLTFFTREVCAEKWALTQNNLGGAYIDRRKGKKAQNIEQAIACFQEALKVYTFDAFPEDWAMTQYNLALAYRNRITGDKSQNIEQQIAFFQESLKIRTFQALPQAWARIQCYLGEAYRNRITGDKADNIEKAITCWQEVLKVYTFDTFPRDWALTQNNIALAYHHRITGDKADNIERAIACYQEYLKVYTFDAFPQEWALTQNNIALAYHHRITGDKSDNLEYAISCLKKALTVITFDAFSQDWATIQSHIAGIYLDRIKGDKAQNIERTISGCKETLKVITVEAYPQQWGNLQTNLGNAYFYRMRGNKAENIERAIASYQEVLKVRTFEACPQDWAGTLDNLGNAYFLRIRGDKAENIERAIACYQQALKVYTFDAFPQYWKTIQAPLGAAYLNRITGEKAQNLKQAIACFQKALKIDTVDAFTLNEGRLQAYRKLIEQLLRQSKDEEVFNVLNSYRDLVDGGFQQTMLVVAEDLRIQGNVDKSYFLTNIVEQLMGVHQKTFDDPIDFLLEVVQESNGDRQIIYRLLAANTDKLNQKLAEELQPWAITKLSEVKPDEAKCIVAGISIFSDLIQTFPLGDKASNMEIAITGYKVVLTVLTRDQFPEAWAMTQSNLGIAYCYRIKGDKAQNLELSIACHQKALKVYTFEAFPQDWAKAQHNIGVAYRNRITGNKAENVELGIACYQNALKVITFDAFTQDWARTQTTLGNAYRNRIKGDKTQNLEQAIAFHQNALKVYTLDAFPQEWALTQTNLGNAYLQIIEVDDVDKEQNLEQAIACHQNALKVYTFDAFPQEWAVTKNNLGNAYIYRIKGDKEQNLEQTIACCQEALRVRTFEAFPEKHVETLFVLGLAYQDSNQFNLAYSTFASAIDTVESLREEIISGDESKRKQAEEWNKLYISMVAVCIELDKSSEAIEYVERSKTRNLVEEILRRDMKTIFTPKFVTQLEHYRNEIAAGQEQIQQGNAKNQKDLAQHLQKLRQQRNELQDQHLPIASGFNFKQFQNNLDDHTAIVEFYITRDKLLTFIFTGQTQQPIVFQSEPKDLEKLIKWFKGYFIAYYNKKSHWQRRLTTRLNLLAKILHIDDIIEQIPETCDRLILIPHQYLHLFPIHALPINSKQGEGKSKILMDRFPAGVSYAPSCQLLQLTKTRKRPEEFTHLFAVQNPTDDLDYTNLEVEVIKSFFQAAEVLASQDAKEATIKVNQNLTTAHYCHFSCHGYFNPESPVESALVLAETKTKQIVQDKTTEDGFLTLGEIFGLKLEQCRLVTLSACETGLIDFKNSSDEYIGLPSGFLVAGSPAVVSSLWTVHELSTALLMIKFYDNLLNYQMSLAVALNQAQLWLRDVTKENLLLWIKRLSIKGYQKRFLSAPLLKNDDFRHLSPNDKPFEEPYHWAAFCAIGQ
ncbi:MAG: tetratricopeptide repeat protein [Moorea sp. SIO1F2]|uniref:CHAT domain-containing protein n=1 Tax=Moorena sp. SIO1F2 TaxID=2607819 RepID=UPI0013BB60AF|nr:CHAT domain-containing protein [Moorena sp. SIO1F2]NET84735.1 tetratricopeptide repeat protein [Moorena sp. SIO1F2]